MQEQVSSKLLPALAAYRTAEQQLQQTVAEHLPTGSVVRVNSIFPSFSGVGIVHGAQGLCDRVFVRMQGGEIYSYCLEAIEEVLPTEQWPLWVREHFGVYVLDPEGE
jgi:hypothetical protein